MSRRGGLRVLVPGGALYYLVVFAVGFVLGVVRTTWLVPVMGERWAELAEIPLMLFAIVLAAQWVVRRFDLRDRSVGLRLGVGALALVLLLATELTVVLRLRGLSLSGYLRARDPVSGIAYAVSLLLFAAMPALIAAPRGRR